MNVKATFHNDVIEEEIYVIQLRGFVVHGRYTHVCRFKNALYGLKQAPHADTPRSINTY
jgi:hypothetical protein